MKKAIPNLSEAKQALAVRTEQSLLSQLPIDTDKLRKAVKYFEPGKLKLYALVAVGGMALLTLFESLSQAHMYRSAVSKEMKKQLAPVNEKLAELEAQNDALKRQNDELKKELAQK